MNITGVRRWSRREFLDGAVRGTAASFLGLGSGALAADLLRLPARAAAAEPPPEITKIRLQRTVSICVAPIYLAQEFLPAEGFTEINYVETGRQVYARAIVSGQVDIALNFSGPLIIPIDAGEPLVILGGAHVGCFELFGAERVRAIRDLKGKVVAVSEMGGPDHVFLSSILAYVGVDPRRDVNWVAHPFKDWADLFAQKKIDAGLTFPPFSQELRAKKAGHVILNSMMDPPWSQYFCCMAYTSREFLQKYPVATKRVLRAILKGADLCARQPERAARLLVDRGYTKNYDYALRTMRDVVYGRWREYDPEDTLRFYALRLREAGMIKNSPQAIIARGADWRFFNELKRG